MQLYQAHSPRSILESTLGLMEQDQAEGRVNEQELADLVRVAMVTGHSSLAVQALELAIGVVVISAQTWPRVQYTLGAPADSFAAPHILPRRVLHDMRALC